MVAQNAVIVFGKNIPAVKIKYKYYKMMGGRGEVKKKNLPLTFKIQGFTKITVGSRNMLSNYA